MINIDEFRVVNDFPKPGIKFYDITTLMNDAARYQEVFKELLEAAKKVEPEVVVALETRGFFFGPSLALALNVPFVPVRKKGKLPYKTFSHDYELEYGVDTIEVHADAMAEGKRVLIFDDILATGGTASAAVRLIENFNPAKIDVFFIMEITALKGRNRIPNVSSVCSLLSI